jgi:hypothetical protein
LTAAHARRCSMTGEQNTRHNILRDMVFDTLQSCTRLVLVRKEDAGPFMQCGFTNLIMDVTWQPGYMLLGHFGANDNRAQPLTDQSSRPGGLLDASVIDETCPQLVKMGVRAKTGPVYITGAAALTRVKEKHKTYGGKHPSNFTLIPFVLEQSGASCLHVHTFVKAAAQHEYDMSDGAWPLSAIVQRWRQKISVALQKSLSITTTRVFSRVRAVRGRPAPVANRHEVVHLLVRPPLVQVKNPVEVNIELDPVPQQLLPLSKSGEKDQIALQMPLVEVHSSLQCVCVFIAYYDLRCLG